MNVSWRSSSLPSGLPMVLAALLLGCGGGGGPSGTPSGGAISLALVNPLASATVGQTPSYSQSVVGTITPASTYTYSIDTLASGNGVPTGMTLNAAGVLSGTPFATGAADVNGYQISHAYTFGVCAKDTLSLVETTPCPQTSLTVLPLNVTVTVAGTGSGTVDPSPAGDSCGANCYSGYTSASTVTLTATPDADSTFTGWSGACTGAGSCSLTMSTSRAVTATFDSSASLTGTWTGTWSWSGPGSNGCQFSDGGAFSMTLTQTGTSFAGTDSVGGVQTRDNSTCALISTGTGSGSASGTVSGTAVTLTFNDGAFTGPATLSGDTLTGSFVRTTGGSGTFTVTRQ